MSKTQKNESLKSDENGLIKGNFNISAIKPEEIFSYLGEEFVVRLHPREKLDAEGNPIPKKFLSPAGAYVDGYVMDTPEPKLYKVVKTVTSSKKTIESHGRPLNVRADYIGPINANEIFTVKGKPLKYNNVKLRDLKVTVGDNEIVTA